MMIRTVTVRRDYAGIIIGHGAVAGGSGHCEYQKALPFIIEGALATVRTCPIPTDAAAVSENMYAYIAALVLAWRC
jgi:hypothetical protein